MRLYSQSYFTSFLYLRNTLSLSAVGILSVLAETFAMENHHLVVERVICADGIVRIWWNLIGRDGDTFGSYFALLDRVPGALAFCHD